MPRTYRQYCSLARALDLIGERWTLLIIRDLLGGPKRYKDLLQSLKGIGTNLLANRLKELESSGLIEQTILPPPASVQAYRLTQQGAALQPTVVALADWGLSLLDQPRNKDHWSPQWNHIAFHARFNTEAAKDISETYAFNIDGYPHYAVVDHGTLTSFEGQAPNPSFTLTTNSETFVAVLEGQGTFVNSIASGDMMLEGDIEALQRCMTVFNKKTDP